MGYAIMGIAIFFFLGHALRVLFLKTKIPDLLFLVAIGYLLGPVLGILRLEDFGKVGNVLATIALIVILYEGGLGLRTRELLTSSVPAVGLALFTFVTVVGLTTGLVLLLTKQTLLTALLTGVGIGSTSSAIVIPLVRNLNITPESKTILALESAITDVLVIVVFLILMDSGVSSKRLDTTTLFMGLGPDTLKAILLGLFAGFLWAVFRKKFSSVTDVAFAGEAWALFIYAFIEMVGLNGAMGVLALGFMLSNLQYLPSWARHMCNPDPVDSQDMALLQEVSFLLRTFFFVYLGMLIRFSNIKILGLSVLLCFVVFLTRYLATRLIFRPARCVRMDAMMIAAMGPRGLACAVLAMLPAQKGIEGGEFIQLTVFAIIPITIALTAIFVFLIENPVQRQSLAWAFGAYTEAAEDSFRQVDSETNPESETAPSLIPPGEN